MNGITAADIRKSWEDTGLWPIDFRYVKNFEARKEEIRAAQEEFRVRMTSAGPATALESVNRRVSHRETLKLLVAIVEEAKQKEGIGKSVAIQKAAICLKTHQSVNSILMSEAREFSVALNLRTSGNVTHASHKTKHVALPSGTSAENLTNGDVLQKRNEKEVTNAVVEALKTEKRCQQAKRERRKKWPRQNVRETEHKQLSNREHNANRISGNIVQCPRDNCNPL